jgi:predicted ATPase
MSNMTSIRIRGYRPFRDFTAPLGKLEVLVGANGAGKSAFFEFLKFLRDSVYQDIPPEIIAGSVGQAIFHLPGEERFWWSLDMDFGQTHPLRYQGQIDGPIGQTRVTFERVLTVPPRDTLKPRVFLDMQGQKGLIGGEREQDRHESFQLKRPNQLALSTATNPNLITLYALREYIASWRFYSAFRIAHDKIRKPVPIEQDPVLHEDGGNLSALLFYLLTEHRQRFDELQSALRSMIPDFQGLSVKARGRGEVIAFWQEHGVNEGELSLADVSDGILRLLCWAVLAIQPNPPPLIGIDEPDQGVHPRTLPILAGLFQKASSRTQILLTTHASYFLTQFPLEAIAIMRKEDGQAIFAKPRDSLTMRAWLDDFGTDELEQLHRSDELERLS